MIVHAVKANMRDQYPFVAFTDEQSARRIVKRMHGDDAHVSSYIARIHVYRDYIEYERGQ